MTIGIPKEYRVDGMPDDIESLWQAGADWLKAAGAEVIEVSLPHTKYALAAYYIVNPAEASSNLARYDGVRYGRRVAGRDVVEMYEKTRAEGFGREVRRRVLIGTYVLSAGYYDAYYLRAQKVRTLIKRDFEDCFARGVDAVRDWREGRGPGGNVPERYLYGDGEHGGPARHRRTGRARRGRPATRPATHRPAVRRGDIVCARAGHRGRRGALFAGKVVVVTLAAFRRSITRPRPPAGLAPALTALWWAKNGDWAKAHDIVMDAGGADCAWVHAYLHREEGDVDNARYWYRQAGRAAATGSLAAEWNAIVAVLVSRNATSRA
jgi:hypothetical protein